MNSIRNRGVLGVQTSQLIGGAATGASVYTAIDTSVDKSITITGDTATPTDHMILEGYTIQLLPKD